MNEWLINEWVMNEWINEIFDWLIQKTVKVENLIKVYIDIIMVLFETKGCKFSFIYQSFDAGSRAFFFFILSHGFLVFFLVLKHTNNPPFAISNFVIFKGEQDKCQAIWVQNSFRFSEFLSQIIYSYFFLHLIQQPFLSYCISFPIAAVTNYH